MGKRDRNQQCAVVLSCILEKLNTAIKIFGLNSYYLRHLAYAAFTFKITIVLQDHLLQTCKYVGSVKMFAEGDVNDSRESHLHFIIKGIEIIGDDLPNKHYETL